MPNYQTTHNWFVLSAIVVSCDQASKWLAESYLEPMRPLNILPFFDLVLAYNNGAAFSILQNAGGWQRYFLIAITLVVLAVLVRWLWTVNDNNQKLLSISLALILGGAVGNLIDRIITGEVIDFLSFYYYNLRWPTFNLADLAISIGIILLVVDIIFFNSNNSGNSIEDYPDA